MFARYLGEDGFGLTPKEIYYINVNEQLVQEKRKLTIVVGDFWASDYDSFGEAMTEWDFTQWQDEHKRLSNITNGPASSLR